MTHLLNIEPGIEHHTTLNFLVVEDDKDTAEIMKKLLEKKFHAHAEMVENCNQARDRVNASHFDLVTLDYQLPDGNGLKLLREIKEKRDAPAVLIVTGKGDEQIAANSLKFGASAYIIKDQEIASSLPEAVENVLDRIALSSARKQIDELTKEKEAILDNMAEHVAYISTDYRILWANKAAGYSTGAASEKLIGRRCHEIWHQRREPCESCPIRTVPDKKTTVGEEITTSADRSWYLKCSPVTASDGKIAGIIHVGLEITDWKRADKELEKSEEKYRTLFNSLQEEMCAVSEHEKITLMNQKMAEALGYSIKEVIGKPLSRFMEPASINIYKRFVVRRNTGKTERHEFEFRKNDGSRLARTMEIAPLVNARNEYEGTILSVISPSAPVIGEDVKGDTAKLYRSLFEDAPHANFSLGIDGTIKKANFKACELTGFSIENLIGKPFAQIFSETTLEREKAQNIFKAALESGPAESTELQVRDADGNAIWVSISVKPIINRKGDVIETQVVASDITDRKNASESLERINSELEGYAHTVSHDLKGPLSATTLCLEILEGTIQKVKDPTLSSELSELLESIKANTDRSYKLVEDLLSLAKAGQEPKNIFSIEIREVIDEVLRERKDEINENGIEIKISDNCGRVTGNPVQIYAIFSNIIGNSIRHNTSREPVIEISYKGFDQNKGHVYLIRDNGPGIKPDDLGNIFKPFYKGAGSRGTGIGLSTALRITEVYNGNITAYNLDGACFEVSLKDYEQ
ncbi:MAG: PAS domain S-box protein [Actinobacteria bacterium]|nr:PAS domain S-box protein [Actinomycetota bacterium]